MKEIKWTKINSEKDYPKDWETLWVYSDIVELATYDPNQEYFKDTEGVVIKKVTHYGKFEKPVPPKPTDK